MPLVMAASMLVAIAVGITAWSLVAQAQQTQRQVQAAAAYTLKVAAIDGTTALPNGSFLIDAATAQIAAVSAVPLALPVTLQSPTANGATYTPTSQAPAGWGTLTLSGFTVGNSTQPAGGSACSGSNPSLATCPYVQAAFSMPYTLYLWGVPIPSTVSAAATQVIDVYNAVPGTFSN